MKVHDLKPPPGFASRRAARRPRHRRQGRQDRRPRHQGPGRARQRRARLRGWPDAAAPPHAEGQGLQEPVPGRVPRREPRHARRVRRRRRGLARDAARRGASWPSRAWSRCSAAASSRRRSRSRPTASPAAATRPSRRPAARVEVLPAAVGRSPSARPGQRPDQPIGSAVSPSRLEEVARPMLSRLRNMFRVPDLRNKILFTILIVAVYRLGAHIPVPYVDFSAIKELQDSREHRRRRRVPRPVLRRRDHERRDLLPRDHAVHHGVDHHAAARRRDPEARAVAATRARSGRRRSRSGPATSPSALALVQSTGFVFALHEGKRGLLGFVRLPGRRPHPRLQRRQGRAHRAHVDGRYRAGDVARRAHHPTRHRQRHVDPDLRVGRVAPSRARARRSAAEGSEVPVLHDHRSSASR